MAIADWNDCLASLPEDPATALLTEMLVPVPYEVPEKKAKKKDVGTRKSLRCNVVPEKKAKKKKTTGTRRSTRNVVLLGSSSDKSETPSSRENEEEEE